MTETVSHTIDAAPVFQDIENAIATLVANKSRWAQLAVPERLVHLKAMRDRIPAVAARWVDAAVRAKGIGVTPALAGEEWTSGPWAMLRAVKQLIENLENLAAGGSGIGDRLPHRQLVSGQTVVEVFPRTIFDKLLLNGVRAEVWLQAGANTSSAAAYRQDVTSRHGELALVLGAGNIASIAPLDALYKLYTDLSVVILKLNPVNEYLRPFIEEIFATLIRDGFVKVVCGGADVGAWLCNHSSIDTMHITGSIVTHDAIVFGKGQRGVAPRVPINSKPITSELGGVSPVIVVPGPWTDADIEFQAKNIASQRLHNGGFNCIASQVVVMSDAWKKTEQLERAVASAISAAPDRPAYYPGAEQRKEKFRSQYPEHVKSIEKPAGRGHLLIPIPADHALTDQFIYREEAFAPVLGMTRLSHADELDFLRKAIDFANERLAGTLGASIIIHPSTLEKLGPQFESEIARLRYGCIAVNLWSGVGFLLTEASWGAFPGHSLDDVQSGIGTVHNTFMFDHPERTVIYGPFHPFPRGISAGKIGFLPPPPWFVFHRSADQVAKRLFSFEDKPSWLKLPGIMLHAMRH